MYKPLLPCYRNHASVFRTKSGYNFVHLPVPDCIDINSTFKFRVANILWEGFLPENFETGHAHPSSVKLNIGFQNCLCFVNYTPLHCRRVTIALPH